MQDGHSTLLKSAAIFHRCKMSHQFGHVKIRALSLLDVSLITKQLFSAYDQFENYIATLMIFFMRNNNSILQFCGAIVQARTFHIFDK